MKYYAPYINEEENGPLICVVVNGPKTDREIAERIKNEKRLKKEIRKLTNLEGETLTRFCEADLSRIYKNLIKKRKKR